MSNSGQVTSNVCCRYNDALHCSSQFHLHSWSNFSTSPSMVALFYSFRRRLNHENAQMVKWKKAARSTYASARKQEGPSPAGNSKVLDANRLAHLTSTPAETLEDQMAMSSSHSCSFLTKSRMSSGKPSSSAKSSVGVASAWTGAFLPRGLGVAFGFLLGVSSSLSPLRFLGVAGVVVPAGSC